MVALAPLFLVCRWRYTPYPAQQQKTIKEKTKLNTIIWFTFCSGYRWDSTIFSRPDPDSKNFVLPVLVRKEWFWIWRYVRAKTGVGNKKTDGSLTVLWIRDILVQIRIRIHCICTSDKRIRIDFESGSGSWYFRQRPSRWQLKLFFFYVSLLITFWSYIYIIFQR